MLYLDRGFCSGPVIAYLREKKQPAILACTIRGKDGGTRQLCRGRKSYRTTYTFTDGTTAEMAVVATLVPDKHKQRRRKWLLFVVLGLDWKPQTVYQRYRSRFGIESSYRILRRVRIKTTSRNPAFRFFRCSGAVCLALGQSLGLPALVCRPSPRSWSPSTSTRSAFSSRPSSLCSDVPLNNVEAL